jgi:hypothetical protein
MQAEPDFHVKVSNSVLAFIWYCLDTVNIVVLYRFYSQIAYVQILAFLLSCASVSLSVE